MIPELIKLDHSFFFFINHLPHNFFLDSFFAFISGVGQWILWVFLALIIYIWEKRKDKITLLLVLLAGVSTLLLTDLALKNIVKRPRPEFSIPTTIVVLDKTSSYSFPSGHATIAFAIAYIYSRKHKEWKWAYYFLAILVAFSRIYLGKHYPSDVFIGALIGLFIGASCIKITERTIRQ